MPIALGTFNSFAFFFFLALNYSGATWVTKVIIKLVQGLISTGCDMHVRENHNNTLLLEVRLQ
jgi:hypothetical protein